MFIGHYGVAFALKRAEPKVSLGVLFLAVQLVDLFWGVFVLLGWERVRIAPGYTAVNPFDFVYYPITHSLVAALCWGLVAAGVYYSWPTRDTSRHWQASAVVGLAVASHYPLDVIVHLPDLPIAGSESRKLGLGLWESLPATVAVELLLLLLGAVAYATLRSRRYAPRRGRVAVAVVVLVALYAASLLGPPPPNTTAVGIGVIVIALAVTALGAWAGRPGAPDTGARR